MATTRAYLTRDNAQVPSANFASLGKINASERRSVLVFNPAAPSDEEAMWDITGWEGLTTPVTAIVNFTCAANTGNVQFNASVEAITPNVDTIDMATATGYDTENTGTPQTVPGTAGHPGSQSITLTNDDGIAVDDMVRIMVACDVTGSTTAGDVQIIGVAIKDAA